MIAVGHRAFDFIKIKIMLKKTSKKEKKQNIVEMPLVNPNAQE